MKLSSISLIAAALVALASSATAAAPHHLFKRDVNLYSRGLRLSDYSVPNRHKHVQKELDTALNFTDQASGLARDANEYGLALKHLTDAAKLEVRRDRHKKSAKTSGRTNCADLIEGDLEFAKEKRCLAVGTIARLSNPLHNLGKT